MSQLISEIKRINQILGNGDSAIVTESESENRSKYYIDRIINLLKFNKMYNKTNEKILTM